MGPIKRKKIFIVDNGQNGHFPLKELLSEWDMKIVSREMDDNIINHLTHAHPDLIIFQTHSYNGAVGRLWEDIRETNEVRHVPILAVVPEGTSTGEGNMLRPNVTVLEEPFKKHKLVSILLNNLLMDTAVKFWGVRGSTPCANKENMVFGGNTTCVQVELPDSEEVLILDSGTGIRNLGNHLMDIHETVKGRIFITHPHWDHIQGFPFFKPIYYSENHFDIHMPGQVNGGCKEILSGHLTKTFFPITIEMIDANIEYITQTCEKQAYDIYEIEYMQADHPLNTALYKIHVDGYEIVFAPDNELRPQAESKTPEFYEQFTDFIRGVDVLIHDSQYDRESYRDRVGWGHSAWEEVVHLASSCNVKNLFLTHHDPDSDDIKLDRLEYEIKKEFDSSFQSIQLAREGIKFSIPNM